MADANVLKAQKYLNAMFGGHPSWVRLGYLIIAILLQI